MNAVSALARLCCCAGLCLAVVSGHCATAAWSLIPQPVDVRLAAGPPITIANGSAIAVRGANGEQVRGIADRFVKLVVDTRGLQLRVADSANASITFDIDPHAEVVADDGYRIEVNEQGVRVSARKPQGLFYGSVTLYQLLTQPGWTRGSPAEIAAVVIIDHPRFAWRALMLDSGRHLQSVADIKQLIEWMSLAKLNVLVWHLTEDQGWRIEIPAYPELTRIGACRKAVGIDAELSGSADTPYCGFYTADQIRDVVRFAAERFVTVVPDLDLPGHSQAAVAAYPWLGVTGERPPVWTDWGVSPWLLKPDAKTLRFVDAVLDEVMRLFPSRYVSIGGDEAAKDQWNASAEVRAQMQRLRLANMDQLQSWFTAKVADHLVSRGRTPLGWDDELVAGATLPPSEVVMSWHGNDDERVALDALRQGHDVIMAPQESLYFDHYQSDRADEWSGQAPMSTLQQAYDTLVVPPGATAAQARHILGVQACLWTELMPTFVDDQHAVFPRIAALSELAWSTAAAHDWKNFLGRLPAEIARYRALGIAYADSAFAPSFELTATQDGALRVALSKQVAFGDMRYTIDGSAPATDSAMYSHALDFSAHDNVTLRAATFAPDGFALSAPRTQRIDADAQLSRNGNDLMPCTAQAESTRVPGARPQNRPRPIYKADVGNLCWRWPHAPVAGVQRVVLSVDRVAWQFGDDAARAAVRLKTSAAGEIEIHADACDGPLLASAPLTSAPAPFDITANIETQSATGDHDVCIVATGDPRDGQWTLARVTFQKDGAR